MRYVSSAYLQSAFPLAPSGEYEGSIDVEVMMLILLFYMLSCYINFRFSSVTVLFYLSSIAKLRFVSTFVLINEYE